ncbi:MAG TPA: DUF4864 domain-containing protein [Candidatus Xenobia bacterium]|nr:DUF4864 domain-containing protein [Candidatus Xenobia bacterium]
MTTSTKKLALMIIGAVLLVIIFIGAIGGGIFWLVWEATAEPVRVTRDHLDALNKEDYPRAYSYLSSSLQAELSLEDFAEHVRSNPQIFKTTDSTFSNRKIENDVCTLRGALTSTAGGKTPVRVILVKEGDQWRIRGFRWGDGATEEEE